MAETYIPDIPLPSDTGYTWREPDIRGSIIVEPGKVILPTGTIITTDKYGNPLKYELAEAIRRSEKYSVHTIYCKGVLKGAQIGDGDPNKPFVAKWKGPIVDLIITSLDPNNPATIQAPSIWGDYRLGSGVDHLLFSNLIFATEPYTAGGSSKYGLLVAQGSWQGLIGVHDCRWVATNPNDWQGYGIMWQIRGHGRARWDIKRNKFIRCQEHAIYLDSVGADQLGHTFITDNECFGPCGRTMLQLCNRKDVAAGGGPESGGNVFIYRNKAQVANYGGGSALTVAGHSGSVYVDDLEVTGTTGAIAFWSDAGKGLYLNANGYTCDYAYFNNIRINMPQADRSHIMISGVEKVQFDSFEIVGNKVAIELDSRYGGPIKNGIVQIAVPNPVSAYQGFKAYRKVMKNQINLTDAQIDAQLKYF